MLAKVLLSTTVVVKNRACGGHLAQAELTVYVSCLIVRCLWVEPLVSSNGESFGPFDGHGELP